MIRRMTHIDAKAQLIKKTLEAFNLDGLDDKGYFNPEVLRQIGTCKKIEELLPQLCKFYGYYRTEMTTQKCIRLLKLILKDCGYQLELKRQNTRVNGNRWTTRNFYRITEIPNCEESNDVTTTATL